MGRIQTLWPMANITRNVQDSWCTSGILQRHIFGHWDVCQASDQDFEIPTAPIEYGHKLEHSGLWQA